MKRKPGSGGSRKGAGRKPVAEKTGIIQVTLPAAAVAQLIVIGPTAAGAARDIILSRLCGQ